MNQKESLNTRRNNKTDIRSGTKLAFLGMMLALAIIFGYVESLIPVSFGIPGIKLGLSNVVMLFMLCAPNRYHFHAGEIFAVSAARVCIIGFMFGNLFSIAYGLAGAMLSLLVMTLLKQTNRFGVIGISAAGGAAHNVGQICVAYLAAPALPFFWYLPMLLFAGVGTGVLIGILVYSVSVRFVKYD